MKEYRGRGKKEVESRMNSTRERNKTLMRDIEKRKRDRGRKDKIDIFDKKRREGKKC